MRRLPLGLLGLALATTACGPAAPLRVAVPGVSNVNARLVTLEVELPGVDLAAVRGPAGNFVLGASLDPVTARPRGGVAPDCLLRRTASGALTASSARCTDLLGAYAALDAGRRFLLAAGAEAQGPAAVLVEPHDAAPVPGLRYLAATDSFTLASGPLGARVPAAFNPGLAAAAVARRALRPLADLHPDAVDGLAIFLGAAATGDPGYLAASLPGGDPTGASDLARPLSPSEPPGAVLAGALWAWADASGDLVGAARAALAASRALDRGTPAGPDTVLSLVAAQLNGAERDQACAVFRARLGANGAIAACP